MPQVGRFLEPPLGHQTTGPEISGQLPDLHVPHLSSAWSSASQPLKTWFYVGSKPQLCSQAGPPETAFPSWIFGVSGFIKIQGVGSWDCVVFLQQLVDISWFGGEKEFCVPLAAVILKVACGCDGVKLLGLTHSSFGLFCNSCQVF